MEENWDKTFEALSGTFLIKGKVYLNIVIRDDFKNK